MDASVQQQQQQQQAAMEQQQQHHHQQMTNPNENAAQFHAQQAQQSKEAAQTQHSQPQQTADAGTSQVPPGATGATVDSKENANVQHMLLHVPADAKPGQKVTFAAPNGVYYQVTVPEGAKPGTPFRVAVPAVNPVNQWAYFQRMAAQLQSVMPMLQQMPFQGNAGNPATGGTGTTPIMGVRRPRKTRKDKGKSRGPYRIRSERLYAELAAQEGIVPKTGQGGPAAKKQKTAMGAMQTAPAQHQSQEPAQVLGNLVFSKTIYS